MKGIACGLCVDVRMLHPDGWVDCRCGNVSGRWINPQLGTAEYRARDKSTAFGVGFNNHFLGPALRGETGMMQDARELHDRATNAPGFRFDKSQASCWVIVFRPGTTSDTSWATEEV